MITKQITEKGFIIYDIPVKEYYILKTNGYFGGICDSCNLRITSGYYIPVMNYVYCHDCFASWYKRAIYYQEDNEYEDSNIRDIEIMINSLNLDIQEK